MILQSAMNTYIRVHIDNRKDKHKFHWLKLMIDKATGCLQVVDYNCDILFEGLRIDCF